MDAFCLQALWASVLVLAGHVGPQQQHTGDCFVTQLVGGDPPRLPLMRKKRPLGWSYHLEWSWRLNSSGWS